MHAGGYLEGSAEWAIMAEAIGLIQNFPVLVISPEYRLSSEAPYPAAFEDCCAALLYLKDNADTLNVRRDQLMVGGDSAGGALAAALCMYARDTQLVNIAYQMPLYPMLDDRDTDSSRENHAPMWDTEKNHLAWKLYLGDRYGTDAIEPYAAPARQSDLGGLPPAYTIVGELEPFRDETIAFVDALQRAGVEASVDVYPNWFHCMNSVKPELPVCQEARKRFLEKFEYAMTHYFAEQID
ncbi:MAG: alpha/beta hydrolase [Clostridia bacterium]|nr:alpha/beta hydrolase [Clostridia bacterium]